jgi:hypothetical protein
MSDEIKDNKGAGTTPEKVATMKKINEEAARVVGLGNEEK